MNNMFNKLILGFGLIAIGVLYLLDQLDVLTFDLGKLFSTFWPVFIIFFGLKGLFVRNKQSGSGSFIWSLFVIFLGVYFLLNNFGVEAFTYDNMYKFIVPMLLILFGINILLRSSGASNARAELKSEQRREREARRQEQREMKAQMRNRNRAHKNEPLNNYQPINYSPTIDIPELPPLPPLTSKQAEPEDPFRKEKHNFTEQAFKEADKNWKWKNLGHEQNYQQGKVNRSSFIGDIHYGHDEWDLTPMNISLFIGDTVIDLTKATIPDGETTIYASSFIGDFKIFIPNDMQLEVSVTASAFISDMKVLDRYESGLFKNLQAQTRDYADGEKKIRIMVSTFIGDVIVKRVG